MPRAFSDQEKESIRGRLLEKGRECFERYGVRKTSIEDLTSAAGISKGAFYLFFGSKEELFFEIIEQSHDEFRAQLFDAPEPAGLPPRDRLKAFLRRAFSTWKSGALLGAFSQEDYAYLLRKLPEEKIREHMRDDDAFMLQFLETWKSEGLRVDRDPQVVAGLMKALFFVSLHEEDLGPDAFPGTLDLLIDLVVDYLIAE